MIQRLSATPSDGCDAILIQNVSFTTLDTYAQSQYLSIVDQATWDQNKTNAAFLGMVNDILDAVPPLQVSASFDQFQQARTSYFSKTQFSSSNEQRFMAFRQYITDAQANAWAACKAARASSYGPQIFAKQITDTVVALEIFWVAPPGFGSTTVVASGTISGGQTIGQGDLQVNQLLPDGFQLNNQTGATIQIHRAPTEDLVVTLAAPPTGEADYSLRSPVRSGLAIATPIGTIVPSMLPPDRYFDATGEAVSTDYSSRAWVPADGRPVPGSSYARLIGANVPDLRGLFLRCVNVMESSPQIPLDPQQKDPIDRPAGDIRPDKIKAHRHNVSSFTAIVEVQPYNKWEDGDGAMPRLRAGAIAPIASDDPDGNLGSETAPKNTSVFHYIRIN
jgi:hypothetical protein